MANVFDRPVSKYNKDYKENWDSVDANHKSTPNSDRAEVKSAVEEFLAKGGKITKLKTRAKDPAATINRGVSAR